MENLQKNDSSESTSNNQVAQRQAQPGAKGTKQSQQPTIQAKQKPIQAKQQPIQAKQQPIQAKQQPIQRNTGSSAAGGNTNEAQVKANVSALTGTDVTDAKVHYNSNKPAQLQAEATAQGDQVHLASGKEKHLGHELTHVAQQKQGRVKPTIQANNGVGINNDPKLEKEADDIGAKAQSNQPIQAKSISSGKNGNVDQPMQLKLTRGIVIPTDGLKMVDVHRSNIKDVDGRGIRIFGKRATEVTVKDKVKANLPKGFRLWYDPEKLDKSGEYVWVKYSVIDDEGDQVDKIGYVLASQVKQYFTKEERQEQERRKKEARKKERQQKKQKEKASIPQKLRDKSNVGVEVEMRNITLTRQDKDWQEEGDLVYLSTGGKDGVWVTDQHSGKQAIIEWNSDHPEFEDSGFGANFQEKLDKLYGVLGSNNAGTLENLIGLTAGVMNIGTVNPKYKDVKFIFEGAKQTNTQVNMEVPLANIGKIPQNDLEKKHDSSQLFSGSRSNQAKQVFIKVRKLANDITGQMLSEWNKGKSKPANIGEMKELISTLTIFLHTSIFNGLDGGKDPQAVLFKTGAGDLVRAALKSKQKQVLWHAFHKSDIDFIDELSIKGTKVYKQVFKGRGGKSQEDDIHNTIFDEARAAFWIKDTGEIIDEINNAKTENRQEDYFEHALDYLVALKQQARWGEEENHERYGSSIDTKKTVSFGNKTHGTTDITGVSTGKDFLPTTHTFKGDFYKKTITYVLAEIRRNDNDINKLVKKKGISDEKRKVLAELMQNIQTPY